MPAKPKAAAKPSANRKPAPAPAAPTTKKAQLIAMLREKEGRDVSQLSEALGWLPHTVRAAFVGLRKSGFQIERLSSAESRALRYRITTPVGAVR